MLRKVYNRFYIVLRRQFLKGHDKYGVTLEEADLPVDALINHLEEELVDAWVYLHEIERQILKERR